MRLEKVENKAKPFPENMESSMKILLDTRIYFSLFFYVYITSFAYFMKALFYYVYITSFASLKKIVFCFL